MVRVRLPGDPPLTFDPRRPIMKDAMTFNQRSSQRSASATYALRGHIAFPRKT